MNERPEHYLLYGSERYALAILRPLQDAIRARGAEAAWFFDGPGGEELHDDERWLHTTAEVRRFEAEARRVGHFAVRETGWPKLDSFMRAHATDEPPPVREQPVVLYHSTFSPSWSAANILYDTVNRLSRTGKWRWIVTLHPKSSAETVEKYRALQGEYLRFATEDNILDLFPQVDMMISDTSSALNEFLLTYKPVVTFKNRRPGPQLIDIEMPEQLEPSIERALARPADLMKEVRNYADAIHPWRDGRSSERVLKAVDDFIAAGVRNIRPKPRNFWRKLKIRKRIGYSGPCLNTGTLFACCVVTIGVSLSVGCASLPNGRVWGEDATIRPGWERVREAATHAATDPWVWGPLIGTAAFQIDDWDRRVSDWARENTPVFGSQRNAEDWSDGLRDVSVVAHFATIAATPSGPEPGQWTLNKIRGTLVAAAAVSTTVALTSGLKEATDRERPNGDDSASFPSGHTSSSAVHTRLASRNLQSIDMSEGWRRTCDIGLTALTIGTSWARIEAGWHFPSDTLFGMALGNFIASFVNDAFMGLQNDEGGATVSASVVRDGAVVHWSRRF